MINLDWATIGIIFTIVSAVSSLTWWLSKQFALVKESVFEKIGDTKQVILEKLEYHERHDDSRFSEIREDLSEVRIRNAAKDALLSTMIVKLDKLNGN